MPCRDFIDEVKPTDDADWLTLVRRRGPCRAIASKTTSPPPPPPGRSCPTVTRGRRRDPGWAGVDADGRMQERRCSGHSCDAARAGLIAAVSAQTADSGPMLKILSPGEESYVSGPTLLRATIVPADAVTGVTFFVDGRQVCALTRRRSNATGTPAPRSASTRCARSPRSSAAAARADGAHQAVGDTETVNVDVVQVTVTVSDGRGHFVRNLPRSAFHVSEDGKPQGSRTSRPRTCRSSSSPRSTSPAAWRRRCRS